MTQDPLTQHDRGVQPWVRRPVAPLHRGAGELDFTRLEPGVERSLLARLAESAGLTLLRARRITRGLGGFPEEYRATPGELAFVELVFELPGHVQEALRRSV